MLELRHLTIKTRHPILTDASFSFEGGRLYGIVATNGSGKTTLFRTIAGLIPVMGGELVAESSDFKRDLFFFESSDWFDGQLSGLDYLRLVKSEWQSSADLDKIIAFWGMGDYIKLPVKKYSLGMKQKVLISMYLVSQAKYLLMDEITNGLDEASRAKLFSCLHDLIDKGSLVILSSHYREDIENHCDQILALKSERLEVLS